MANKTEQPTKKRLDDASRKGQILKSRDLVVSSIMLTGIVYLVFFLDFHDIAEVIKKIIENNFEANLMDYCTVMVLTWIKTIGPLFLACAITTIAVSWMQSRLRIATEALKLNFNALNPVNGFKRLFSMRTVKELIKTILYICVIVLAVAVFWDKKKGVFFSTLNGDISTLFSTWGGLLFTLFIYILGSFVILLVLDLLAEYFIFMKDMKMDKEEVKREYKEQEGDPAVKSRRREMHREILSEQMKSDISNSRLIIANPTHIAIGIYFKPEISPIPVVSVKASEAQALAVRKYAEKINIPVIRDIRLARRIYATHKCYDYVCLEEIDAILELLFWLDDVERAGSVMISEDREREDPHDEKVTGDASEADIPDEASSSEGPQGQDSGTDPAEKKRPGQDG